MAVTDANLLLGRLIPDYFPKIFGKTEDQPLDIEASRSAFDQLRAQINEETGKDMGLDEVVYGFIKVANETMARPIRALTEARGYATGKHMYDCSCTPAYTEGLHKCWSDWRALVVRAVNMHARSLRSSASRRS